MVLFSHSLCNTKNGLPQSGNEDKQQQIHQTKSPAIEIFLIDFPYMGKLQNLQKREWEKRIAPRMEIPCEEINCLHAWGKMRLPVREGELRLTPWVKNEAPFLHLTVMDERSPLGKRVVKDDIPSRTDDCPHLPSPKAITAQPTPGEFNRLVNKTREGGW